MKWYEKQKETFKQKNDIQNHLESDNSLTKEGKDTVQTEALAKPLETVLINKEIVNYQEDKAKKPISQETSIIHKNTTLHGDIETDDNVMIYGTLAGDIICRQDITITGNVTGNIDCLNATLNGASIEGNIRCENRITISENTIIHGNLDAQSMECSGHIKGDTKIADTILFTEHAAIIGNITTKEISIDQGAIIQGNITITKDIQI